MKTLGIIFMAFAMVFMGKGAFASLNYEAEIKIDIEKSAVSGKVTMSGNEETALYIPGFYDLKLDGRPVLTKALIVNMPLMDGKSHVLEYKKQVVDGDIISPDFISISSAAPLPLAVTTIKKTFKTELPKGFNAVGEAEEISSKNSIENPSATSFIFTMNKPLRSFDIIASKNYSVKSKKISNVDIYTYFLKENSKLTDDYLKAAEGYIKMYEELFRSKFPYARFSVVEHPYPYGYATPTYTVLGSRVLSLPFMTTTSLGHEILHQWFGAAIDGKNDGSGNWFEAIATFLADMHYLNKAEQEAYRKNVMINYDIYSKDNKTYPLKDFVYNDSRLSQTIGYGKGAMVFHMLYNKLGEEKFYAGIRKLINNNLYKNAGWEEVFASFEGNDFKEYAKLWLDTAEIPEIKVSNSEYIIEKGSPFISFDLERKNGEKVTQIPFTAIYKDNIEEGSLTSVIGKETFKIPVKTGAVKLVIDKDYDIMRKLVGEEVPPIINHILESEKIIVVTDDKNSCDPFFKNLKNIGVIKKASEVTFADAASSNFVICGYGNEVTKGFLGSQKEQAKGISHYAVYKNYRSPGKFILIVSEPSEENVRLVKHYGKYSKIDFEGRKNILKEIEPSQSGIEVFTKEDDMAIIPSSAKILDEIVSEAKNYPAIFIGEKHDDYAHHMNQLEIIKKLKESGIKIAVGFEMIQKQFQNVLDDYISGKIDEKEFLKKSEYFNRWSFDYNLYAPIFRYLQENKIPAIGLNIDGAINKKISSGNFDNLTAEDKKSLPAEINLNNPKYAKEINDIFQMHGNGKSFDKEFTNFYLAQNVWDEVMAESAVKYQKTHPDTTVVVIAGGGHLKKDSGIPLRYARLTGKEGYVILQDAQGDAADAILITSTVGGEDSPKIGVTIAEEKGKVIIMSVGDKSTAEKGGILAKDIIAKCGDTKISSIGDLKYALFSAGYGSDLECAIMRKNKNINITLKLDKSDKAANPHSMEQMMKMMNKKQ